jgi:hypothetical protein
MRGKRRRGFIRRGLSLLATGSLEGWIDGEIRGLGDWGLSWRVGQLDWRGCGGH